MSNKLIITENSNELKLNTNWVLWYHSPEEKDWDIDSYKLIKEFNTITDFWEIFRLLTPIQIQYGMFFLMRHNIMPTWEDPRNINGGSWSFKISKKDTYDAWLNLCISAIGEKITENIENSININGITISPKKNFSIVKIWNSDNNLSDNSLISSNIPFIEMKECLYSVHNKN